MYSIGEFSKINRITTKTLRHYDKIDLLKPTRTDDWTGYRYYSVNQLNDIKQILLYKDMGFPLEQIKELIHSSQVKDKLIKQRLKEIKEEIKLSKNRIKSINKFIENDLLQKNIKGDNRMSEVIIRSLPEVIVASMRTIVPCYDTYFDIVPKMGEYMTSVGAVCSEPAYCFTIYHDGEYKESDIDVEVCEAVIKPCKESDMVKFKTIKGYDKAAVILHTGDYKSIRESYNEIFLWIEKNGYKVIDNPRESYIDGIWNKEDPADWTTEVQIPVK